MSTPPGPPGWPPPSHQQPQPQQGWPQQQPGYPPPGPPGYPPGFQPGPGYPPQPPKPKSKAPKIIAIVAIVLVVLAVGGLAGWRIVVVSSDAGVEANGRKPKAECAVSQQVLDAAKVSVNTSDGTQEDGTHVCGYVTRKGSDGLTESAMGVAVRQVRPEVLTASKDPLTTLTTELAPPTNYMSKPGPQVGDKSMYVWQESGGKTYAALAVLKGQTYYKVTYYGYTKGFFGDSPVALDRVEFDMLTIAKDLDQRIKG